MHTYRLLFWLLGALWLPAQAQQAHVADSLAPARLVFTVTEKPPSFPGGINKLTEYFRTNLRYPKSAKASRLEGKVFVTFIVSEQGAIEEVRVLKAVDPDLDAEAVRVIQRMPTWEPARQSGRAVACRYNIPVNFALNGSIFR